MTKQERRNELKEIVKKEIEELRIKTEEFIQQLIPMKISARVFASKSEKEFSIEVNLINENGEKIFGTGIDIRFRECEYYGKQNNGLMCINYGSCGMHSKLDNDGGLKQKDILVGKLWENEDNLTKLYNDINWCNMQALADVEMEIYKEQQEEQRKEREQKALEKQAKLDKIINEFKEGQVVNYIRKGWYGTTEKMFTIIKITNKCVYINNPVNDITGTWKERYSKEEMAEFILQQNSNNNK